MVFRRASSGRGSSRLDVSHEELRIGVQAYRSGEHVLRRLFIADSLENGAGYAPHLGKDEVFREVMARLANEIKPKLVSEFARIRV